MRQFLFTLFTILLLSSKAFAQMNYTFTVYSQPYVPLTSATRIDSGLIWDNTHNFTAPLGFPFKIDTINCPYFISEGGNVSVTDTATVTFSGFILTDASLDDRGYTTDTVSHSPVKYKLTGTAGHHIFMYEVSNAGFDQQLLDISKMTDSVNLQIWYYEDSGIVELRYGTSLVTGTDYFDPAGPIAGYLEDFVSGNGTVYMLGGNPASPILQKVPISGGMPTIAYSGLSSFPPDGTVYRFTPNFAPLSIGQVFIPENIIVYPTVCTDNVMIKYKGAENLNYDVYSINGAQMNLTGQANKGLNRINISNLPAGMYLLHLQGSADSKVYKFVKM